MSDSADSLEPFRDYLLTIFRTQFPLANQEDDILQIVVCSVGTTVVAWFMFLDNRYTKHVGSYKMLLWSLDYPDYLQQLDKMRAKYLMLCNEKSVSVAQELLEEWKQTPGIQVSRYYFEEDEEYWYNYRYGA